MSIVSIALIFFLVANPIGNGPAILALVKNFDISRQRRILIREAGIALLLAFFFQFFGELFFGQLLQVKPYTNQLTGGILLFLTSLRMIFPPSTTTLDGLEKEPFIVPIATPLLSGPGLLTIIMLKASEENNNVKIFSAILLAWVGVISILMLGPYLQKILKQRGMIALEQLMGMALSFMSIEMVVKGVWLYNQKLI